MQRHIPGGWFFVLFELNSHSSCTNRIEMPVIKNLGGKPIETPSSTHFCNQTHMIRSCPKLMHYAKNVTGINAYWNKARDNLKAIIQEKEAPTILWTLSCADFHWPDGHLAAKSPREDKTKKFTNNDVTKRQQIVREGQEQRVLYVNT
ncbi:unnamed protein product [Porites lobata]|uniref:Uncharacterized protein n=1 Tax=Porites lobata TaxID=104759 RepID=A0ABN8NDT9_9CNID|nr:unnamed protein product [Porites lobata]